MTPNLTPYWLTYTLSVVLMICLPLALAGLLRRRVSVPWLWFSVGMLTFAASQVVHLPLNGWLEDLGILAKSEAGVEPPIWQVALVLGLTAGLCEELARAAGYALLPRTRNLAGSLMLGLGHGGLEAMVFGGVFVASTFTVLAGLVGHDLASTYNLAPDQLAAAQAQMDAFLLSPWAAFGPLAERLAAILIHVTLSVMVMLAFQRPRISRSRISSLLYLLLAIAYHTLLDATLVYVGQTWDNPWLTYGVLGLLILPGALWLIWTVRRERFRASPVNLLGRELNLFATALRKELFQQWRTQRVLITLVVFGLFGMTSPLVAYLMPELMKAIPGAEAFASLIPPPTTGDAMVQFHKNLTQFGFMLALLLGMGAVAGEKERGTAALVLSKPLPRWAFLLSKFTAQVLVYLAGFLLAMGGAILYTLVLFGPFKAEYFLLLNLALFFWLLPFAALTFLGSVIGKSTGAAAGLGIAGVVALMLLGSIPQISALLPTALSGWASQLGSLAAGGALAMGASALPENGILPVAGGALASSLVVCMVCLVASIGLFEEQEL